MVEYIIYVVLLAAGFFSGIFFVTDRIPPIPFDGIAEKVHELYKQKRDSCPKYLIKRAGSIAAEVSQNNTECNNKDVISKDENVHSAVTDNAFQNPKCEFHKAEHSVHDYCCCGCDHTLVECCEIDKWDIVQVVKEVITGK